LFTKASVGIRLRANIYTYLREKKENMYQDKTLKCKECGNDFVFTAGEQEFYASRGFENEPSRCKDCRTARKNAQKGAREMFAAVCVECGKDCQVPFKPTEGKPVYCSECFAAKRAPQE
jgi:CxxC-x17-CxxC domain-containing protein